MRAFIAIELPEEIKSFLKQIQDELKASQADIKWVDPKNCHLTIKFLGEINPDTLRLIISDIKEVADNKKAFAASLSSLGAFPKIDSPRVIWIGIKDGGQNLKDIANDLEERLVKLGIAAEDKEFTAHITLGRAKSSLIE